MLAPLRRFNMAISLACLVSARLLRTVAVAGVLGAGSVSRASAAVRAGNRLDAEGGEGAVGGNQGHAVFVAGFAPERLAALRRDLLDQPLGGEAATTLAPAPPRGDPAGAGRADPRAGRPRSGSKAGYRKEGS